MMSSLHLRLYAAAEAMRRESRQRTKYGSLQQDAAANNLKLPVAQRFRPTILYDSFRFLQDFSYRVRKKKGDSNAIGRPREIP